MGPPRWFGGPDVPQPICVSNADTAVTLTVTAACDEPPARARSGGGRGLGGGLRAPDEGRLGRASGSGRAAVARGGGVRGRTSRRDHRGVGARSRARRRGRDSVAAAGAAIRVAMHLLLDTALMAPVRGWLARAEQAARGSAGDTRARVAGGRQHVRADADRRRPGSPGMVRACDRGGLEARRRGLRRRTGGGDSAAHPGRRRRGRIGDARRGRRGGHVRGPRCALHRDRVLRARLRPAGTGAVRRRGGVDGGDGAVVPHERHRKPARPLSRASRGDPAAARGMRRRGARGAGGVRGVEAVPAP